MNELLKGNETILLVEDDSAVRELLIKSLQYFGYPVVECESADQALLKLSEYSGTIDLIITDVMMPKTDGQQLAQKFKEKFPALKVLYISGYSDDAIDPGELLKPGVGFLAKPFTPVDLAKKIKLILNT